MGAHKGDFSGHTNLAFRFCNIAFLLGGLVEAIREFWLDGKVCSQVWVALEDNQRWKTETSRLIFVTYPPVSEIWCC